LSLQVGTTCQSYNIQIMKKITFLIVLFIFVQYCFSQKKINADFIFDSIYCKHAQINFLDVYAKIENSSALTKDSSVNINCAKYHTIKSEKEFLKILKHDTTLEMCFFYEIKSSKKNKIEKTIEVLYQRATYKGYVSRPQLYHGNSDPIKIHIKLDPVKNKWIINKIEWWDPNFQN